METKGCVLTITLWEVGNQVPRYSGWKLSSSLPCGRFVWVLETKYRDIADGNRRAAAEHPRAFARLETKYRDTADGNCLRS